MENNNLSRRKFIKIGGLTLAGAGITACGIGLARPLEEEVEFTSCTYGEDTMSKTILVIYASDCGSTVEVAAEIGKTIAGRGYTVDVKPVSEKPDPAAYSQVLIGSAVQNSSWLPEALEYVECNREALQNMPVAIFCVHICNLGGNPDEVKKRLAYLDWQRELLHPVGEAFFGGRFDRKGAAKMMPRLLARIMPPLDFRNWKKIRKWAETVDLSQAV